MSGGPSLCPACTAGRVLLDTKDAHRTAPMLNATTGLSRARPATAEAISACEVAMDGEVAP